GSSLGSDQSLPAHGAAGGREAGTGRHAAGTERRRKATNAPPPPSATTIAASATISTGVDTPPAAGVEAAGAGAPGAADPTTSKDGFGCGPLQPAGSGPPGAGCGPVRTGGFAPSSASQS